MPDAQGQPPERPVGPVEDSDMQMRYVVEDY